MLVGWVGWVGRHCVLHSFMGRFHGGVKGTWIRVMVSCMDTFQYRYLFIKIPDVLLLALGLPLCVSQTGWKVSRIWCGQMNQHKENTLFF